MKNYETIESEMLGIFDLTAIPVADCGEELVPLTGTPNVVERQIGTDMLGVTGDAIFVRTTVKNMLSMAGIDLTETLCGASLEVVYGFRSADIQASLFNQMRERNQARGYAGDELLEETHRQIALPEIAGHPTGGAVDLQIIVEDKPLNFGTKIWEFDRKSYTYSPEIDESAMQKRLLLRSIMTNAGFAPFDGEWWHFSYGDREWAAYYKEPNAIYEQQEFRQSGMVY